VDQAGIEPGTVVVVTGGARGIGAAMSRHLATEGAAVVAADVAEPEWEAGDLPVTHERVDVGDEASWRRLVEAVLERHGRIDALVNNAAIYQGLGAKRHFTEIPVEEWDRVLAVNTRGVWLGMRAVHPAMKAQGHGRIVNCSSILGLVPYKWRGAYNASKFALEGLTITMRMELDGSGIHVSLIEPGPIRSSFMANALKAAEANIDLENTVHRIEYQRQLKRLRGELAGAKGKLGPEAVYAALRHALTSPAPKPHYVLTKPAKRGVLLKRLLPSGLFYKILGKLG